MNNSKSKNIILIFIIVILAALIAFVGYSTFSLIEKRQMSQIRTFRATENMYDGHYIIKQDGYGKFYEFKIYDENGDFVSERKYEYDENGYLEKITDNSSVIKYKTDADGKIKSIKSYSDSELLGESRYIEKGNEEEIEDIPDDCDYCIVEYDKYGRLIKGTSYNPDGEKLNSWVSEFNKYGLVRETSESEGDNDYEVKFELIED